MLNFTKIYFGKGKSCKGIEFNKQEEKKQRRGGLAKAKKDEKIRKQLEKEKVADLKKKVKKECPT